MIPNTDKRYVRFARLSLVTLLAVYFLILVGGIVRSTGSGMGCPDWPKCFGQWIPPTSLGELPDNYKDIYAQKRDRKNQKFAKYLIATGFGDLANRILNDKSILVEADFNVYRTWTEYLNRLVGVVIGFLILMTFVKSIPFLKYRKKLFFTALSAFILVILQAWIGSVVVSTNLLTWMVTVHMLLALVIMLLLIYLYHSAINQVTGKDSDVHYAYPKGIKVVIWCCILGVLVQIVLGTQVRETIDAIASSLHYRDRASWVSRVGEAFLWHRSFSWVIVGMHAVLLYYLIKKEVSQSVRRLSKVLMGLIVIAVSSGVVLAYLSMPAFSQPVHLLLATAIFGVQVFLALELNQQSRSKI